jgi:hypothetical protein
VAQLNSQEALMSETRDVSGFSLAEQISAYLQAQGVDVSRALQDAQYAREHAGQRAQAAAGRARDLAGALKRAKRALAFEQEAFCSRRSGSGIGLVSEAQQRVDMLNAALADACVGDPELVTAAKLAAR